MLGSILLTYILQHPGATCAEMQSARHDLAGNIPSTLFKMVQQGLIRRAGAFPFQYYPVERH